MMYIGLYFLFQIFNFRGPLVYQFYYCYMLPSLNKVLLTYLPLAESTIHLSTTVIGGFLLSS